MAKRHKKSGGYSARDIIQYWPLAILLCILIFGTALRAYHLDYPVIGYHNWKETHYVTEARNFAENGFFKEGILLPYSNLPGLRKEASGAHPDTFPMISVITGIAFSIFGSHLAVARTVNLLLGLGAIIAAYLLIRQLFKREDMALAAAFLTALNPLLVYFSHNVQLMAAGTFFMLLSPYFLARWVEKDKPKHLILASLFFSLAVLSKLPFVIMAIPILFMIPWKRVLTLRKRIKEFSISAGILLLIPLWSFYTDVILAERFSIGLGGGRMKSVNFDVVFSSNTFQALKSYAADNYGAYSGGFQIGLFLALLGALALLIMLFLKKKFTLGNRFLVGYIIGAIIWYPIMAEKLAGHNYHQHPVAPLIIFLIAYLFSILAVNLEAILNQFTGHGKSYARYIIIGLLALLLIAPSMAARERMFNTQFIGLDVAGEYIRTNSQPDERVWTSSHQSWGVLWHADRKGYRPPSNVEDFIFGEDERNVRWVLAYQWGLNQFLGNQPVADHLLNNYELVQMGFIQNTGQVQPMWFLFKKGGNTNLSQLNQMAQGKPSYTREYENTKGKTTVSYINFKL